MTAIRTCDQFMTRLALEVAVDALTSSTNERPALLAALHDAGTPAVAAFLRDVDHEVRPYRRYAGRLAKVRAWGDGGQVTDEPDVLAAVARLAEDWVRRANLLRARAGRRSPVDVVTFGEDHRGQRPPGPRLVVFAHEGPTPPPGIGSSSCPGDAA